MRLPDVLGVLGALVVGGLLTVLLLASAVSAPPALPTPVPPTIPPLPTMPPVAATDRPTIEPGETATPGHIVAVGQPAPSLQVTLLDGSLFDTADYAGQPLWINFMATWCPQCVDELPLMERYQRDLRDQLTILVIDVGEDRQTVNQFMRGLDVDLPVGLDPEAEVQAQWGAYALPVHLFIDADGVVQEVVYGGAPLDVWDSAIALVVPEFIPPEGSVPPEG